MLGHTTLRSTRDTNTGRFASSEAQQEQRVVVTKLFKIKFDASPNE